MATTTFQDYTGDGSDLTFDYSFPTYTAADVVVELDGVVVNNYTIPSYATSGTKTVTFDNTTGSLNSTYCESSGAPKTGVSVRVRRDTNVDTAKATYAAGSSVKAGDLNNNQTQVLRALQEEQNTTIVTTKIKNDAVTSDKILDDTIVNANINSAAEIAVSKLADGAARQLLQTDSGGSAVEWTSNVDVPGTLDVTGATDLDGTLNVDGAATLGSTLNVTGTITGNLTGNVTGNISGTAGSATGNAATATDLAAAAKITNSEQAAHTPDDSTYFTTSATEARYFNVSTGETIKDGDTFPDNDTTIATTAAINDRIIDLVDDVGGFVPIANETSFPNANPDVNNGAGTLVSIQTLASSHTSSGSGVITISNGTVGNSTVTINGAENSTTYGPNFGMILETTTTLNTYTFHRLVPKATEVTTLAGKATEIGRLGTAAAVEDLGLLGTTACVADMAILATTDIVADLAILATTDVVADLNTLATTAIVSDLDTCATNVANINAVGGGITNVNAVATNIAGVHHYADVYQVATSAPTARADSGALTAGDMWFDSSSNKELKIHNGTSYQLVTPSQSVLNDISVVSGNITYEEDLGLITESVATGTGNSIETVADAISNVTTVAGVAANVTTVAGISANVTTVAGVSANVTTVAGSIADVNRYANEYTIANSNPGSPSAGDLWYDGSNNVLKYYTGSAWASIAAGISDVASDTSPQLGGALDCNDNNLTEVGTVSGDNLQIDFGTLT